MDKPKPISVACAIIEYKGKVLVAQRASGKSNEGKWEFPGGKIEPDETPEQCIVREIAEELSINVFITEKLPLSRHQYPDRTVILHPFVCSYGGEKIIPGEHQKIEWLLPGDLYSRHWSEADIIVWQYYVTTYLARPKKD